MLDIHQEEMNCHFLKLHVPGLGVLHRFTAADGPDNEPHDHPFAADIVILSGGYVEQVFDLEQPHDPPREVERREGDRFLNEAGTIHRIIRLTAPEVWTLFRPGPHERKSGFYRFDEAGAWHRFWDEPEFRPVG